MTSALPGPPEPDEKSSAGAEDSPVPRVV